MSQFLHIASHRDLTGAIQKYNPTHVVIIRNINSSKDSKGPPWSLAQQGLFEFLDLQFDDNWEVKGNNLANHPQTRDIQRLLYFAQTIKPESRIICSCTAGISRSPAAALILTAASNPGLSPQEAFNRILQVRAQALPNPYMLELAARLGLPQELHTIVSAYRNKFNLDSN